MFIQITDKVKVKSPLCMANQYSYEGPIDQIDLLQQKNNYRLLSESLEPFDQKLSYIWFAKFGDEKIRYHFLAKTEDGTIYWRKYEAETPGSGQNLLYINGEKIKLTKWLEISDEERQSLLENHSSESNV
jgi:hypothetical protein